MPPDMSISMRYTKLKAEEAALIAGEITKPSWESRNEGIHERVSFEDTLWGFDLAGGAYYRTPLRITYVKPDSRAEKAGIKPGDSLVKINGVDTSTLTIQEAHDMIVESGIHIKLSVTSPDDFDDAYYYYEDPIVDDYDSEEERRKEEEKERKRRQVRAKVSPFWSLQWPWVSRRKLIYRESNCFMVPSKYEEQHRDKYPVRPTLRYFDDIILYNADDQKEVGSRQPSKRGNQGNFQNGPHDVMLNDESDLDEDITNDSSNPTVNDQDEIEDKSHDDLEIDEVTDGSIDIENSSESLDVAHDTMLNDAKDNKILDTNNISNGIVENSDSENLGENFNGAETAVEHSVVNNISKETNDNEVINEVLGKTDIPKDDDDNILDSILSDDGQNTENSESMNER